MTTLPLSLTSKMANPGPAGACLETGRKLLVCLRIVNCLPRHFLVYPFMLGQQDAPHVEYFSIRRVVVDNRNAPNREYFRVDVLQPAYFWYG